MNEDRHVLCDKQLCMENFQFFSKYSFIFSVMLSCAAFTHVFICSKCIYLKIHFFCRKIYHVRSNLYPHARDTPLECQNSMSIVIEQIGFLSSDLFMNP
jgi:hypothetical protein